MSHERPLTATQRAYLRDFDCLLLTKDRRMRLEARAKMRRGLAEMLDEADVTLDPRVPHKHTSVLAA